MQRSLRTTLIVSAATLVAGVTALVVWPAQASTTSSLATCSHFSDVVPPERFVGATSDSSTQASMADLSGRLPAPGNVQGSLAGGTVTFTFDRVDQAVAYRVWRNGQSVGRIEDWGQSTLSVTDSTPCQSAYYTVAALSGDGAVDSVASIGQLSVAYQLGDSGIVEAAPLATGTTFTYTVTSYSDVAQTASGYASGVGFCAVDARYIPWGTRLKVDGYGYCYAADLGTWIQGEIIDVWLPEAEATTWGVQTRTITVVSSE